MKPGEDQTEFVKARCEPASMPRVRDRQEGDQFTPSEIKEMRSMTGSLHWETGGTRPDEGLRDQSAAEETIKTHVSDHKRPVQTINA